MKKFSEVSLFKFFVLKGELGDIAFVKAMPTSKGNALCIHSENGTYQKGTVYFIQNDEEVLSYE